LNICMVGTGYVGLVAGTCLSDFGMNVTCVDKVPAKINLLNGGDVPIYEIGLSDLIQKNVKLGRLHFSTDLKSTIDKCLVIFLAVGTPEGDDGQADLSHINEVAAEIAGCMNEYKIIALKSTVPVGTAASLKKLIKANLKTNVDFDVVSNPEFLREGSAVEDFLRPNRVILGCDSDRALAIMRDIYRPLFLLETPIVSTSNETAEMIKYAANTMLALRISFINEIANLCELVGADVYPVAVALGMDKRIGPKFLHPGPGYGGSCFPKDVNALYNLSQNINYDFKIAKAILDVNQRQRMLVADKCRAALGTLENKRICILGLSFKPNTDDVREAPAITIIKKLAEEGALVNAYDPIAMKEAKKELGNISNLEYFKNSYDACQNADMVVILTEWNEFRDLNLDRLKSSLKQPIIFDSRNIYDPEIIKDAGFTYIGTGRS